MTNVKFVQLSTKSNVHENKSKVFCVVNAFEGTAFQAIKKTFKSMLITYMNKLLETLNTNEKYCCHCQFYRWQ